MINRNKIALISIVVAGLITATATTNYIIEAQDDREVYSAVYTKGNVIKLGSDVNEDTVAELLKAFKKQNRKWTNEPIVLHITSPGGLKFKGKDVVNEIRNSRRKVITFVDNHAMSKGFSFFKEGYQRVITHDAILLIHRGSAGHSYFELKGIEKYLTKKIEKLETADADKPKEEKTQGLLGLLGGGAGDKDLEILEARAQLTQVRDLITLMDVTSQSTIKWLEALKPTAKNKTLLESVINDYIIGERDVILTAEQALDAGIATEIVNSLEDIK